MTVRKTIMLYIYSILLWVENNYMFQSTPSVRVVFCTDASPGILRQHNCVFRDTQLRYTRTYNSGGSLRNPVSEIELEGPWVISLSLPIFTLMLLIFFLSSFLSPFAHPATLFHSRNWLWTRWSIKNATATARTRIKIAAFLEAR